MSNDHRKNSEFNWDAAVARHRDDSESAVRSRARRRGYGVRRLRGRTDSYGPILLIDPYNMVVRWSLQSWAEAAAALEREIGGDQR